MTPEEYEDTLRIASVYPNLKLVSVSSVDMLAPLERLYREGMPSGSKPGWPSVDELYSVMPGMLTIVTGWPGSGKSEWIDALLLNLAKQGWRFALYSAENRPLEWHIVKYVEKLIGKPYRPGPTERMSFDEAREAFDEIREWFGNLVPKRDTQEDVFPVEEILSSAEMHFRMHGWWHLQEVRKGLLIDPWNELEHLRPAHMSETEYVSHALSVIRAWARRTGVHVWIVAHPAKLPRDRDTGKLPIPKPDSISGSAHWWNKADCAITVHRELGGEASRDNITEIYVWKIRFKHLGHPGQTELRYDKPTGRYFENLRGIGDVKGIK